MDWVGSPFQTLRAPHISSLYFRSVSGKLLTAPTLLKVDHSILGSAGSGFRFGGVSSFAPSSPGAEHVLIAPTRSLPGTSNHFLSMPSTVGSPARTSLRAASHSTTAALGSTLNVNQINSLVPAVGTAFEGFSLNPETGQSATVSAPAIDSREHFATAYRGADALRSTSGKLPVPVTLLLDVDESTPGSAGLDFRLGHLLSFARGSAGVDRRLIVPDRSLLVASNYSRPASNSVGSRSRANLGAGRGLEGRIATGALEFPLMKPFTKPNFHFALQ